MPPIGDSLREARMRQQLDIADVEERTKIRAKYLRALENEEFGMLPGPTAVRAFLRTYAQLLGLDPHVLLEEYRTTHDTEEADAQPFAEQAPPAPPPRRPRPSAPIGPPPRGLVAGGLVVALIAFLLILGLSAGNDDNGGKGKKTETEQARTTPKRKPKPRKPKPPTGVALKISPTVPTYLCIDKGPGTQIVYQGTLSEPRSFKDPNKLRINMGKTSPAVEFNGKKLPIQQTGNPVGYEFSRTGSKTLEVGQRPCA